MSPERIRIAELAKEDKERRFSSIAHLLTVEALQEAFEGFPHPIRSVVRPFPPMGPVAATSSVALRFPIFIGSMGS